MFRIEYHDCFAWLGTYYFDDLLNCSSLIVIGTSDFIPNFTIFNLPVTIMKLHKTYFSYDVLKDDTMLNIYLLKAGNS